MKVFQCMVSLEMHYYYERYRVKQGQLIRADDQQLIGFFNGHGNIREIFDEKLIRLAPPLHLIRQPEDPFRMRKEDIIFELRSYGIAVDPYNFSDRLSSQLTLARKMLKRNFITIMNERGVPVYIDSTELPVPALDRQDNELVEPEEPKGEFFQLVEEEELTPPTPPKQEEREELQVDEEETKEFVMSMDEVVDPDVEKNKGKVDFEDWVVNKYEGQDVSKEKEIEKLLFKEQEPKIEERVVEQRERQVGITNEEIVPENFKHLTDTSTKLNKAFILNKVAEEDKEALREVKWSKVNIDVLENYLRKQEIKVTYDENDPKKRWEIVNVTRTFLENSKEKDKIAVEINMLQKRHEEITKMEPHFRKSSDKTLKRKATELTKYGLDVWYDKDTNIRKFCQKLYVIAKLGLDVPETEEGVDELLREHRRSALLK
jgi:hypothetical protein